MDVIILLGPPGSGKGTQAKLLANKLGFIHASTGDLLREKITKKTKLGSQIGEKINCGELVPDALIIKIIKNFLIKNKNKNILLDGFPRTTPQAFALIKFIDELKLGKIKIINIEIKDDEAVKRILHRAGLQNRKDDNKKVAKERLKVYHKEIMPILAYFTSVDKIIFNIKGGGKIKDVHESIVNRMKI